MHKIDVTTRRLRVENVVGDAVRQVNVVRTITLPTLDNIPILAKKIESVDSTVRGVEFKIIDDKIIVEAMLHKQIYYVECITGDVQEFTVPDERVTEFIHIEGARPGMTARVTVDIEYCDVEAVRLPGQECHRQFQQTCILRIRARVVEIVEIDVVTNVIGEGLTPTFETIVIDNVIGTGCRQHTISDSVVVLPADVVVKKIKSVDAVIRDVEQKILPGKVVVKGIIHKQIYYVTEPVGEVREVSADVPFSIFVEVPGAREGLTVTSDVRIEYIDSKLVNGTQVKETVVLEVCATVVERMTINIVTAVAGAEVDVRTLRIQSTVGEACRQVNIMADIRLPETDPARKVARVDATLRDLTGEVIPNKVIVRGILHKQIYYVSAVNNQLREITVEEPFTEFVHVEGAQPGDTVDVRGRIEYVNVEAAMQIPTIHWRQTAVLEVCAKVTETRDITVVIAVRPIEVPPVPFCPPGATFDYVVQRGETLSIIAKKFGVTVQAILAVNPQIKDPNIIFTGQTIKIPCPPAMG